MEAQAIGLPTVATNVGSAYQTVVDGKSAFLVPSSDIDAMAEKLNRLILHPEQWSQMAETGRKHIENNYDINQLNKRLVAIYENIIS